MMRAIDGSDEVDLTLLRTLDVLLAERNVTRAARRLGVTQPTVSHALARLRVVLRDPLLVRDGRGMTLSPRAEALAGPLSRALRDLARLVREGSAFDPAASDRTFVLACPDLMAPALPGVLARLWKSAPGVTVDVRAPSRDTQEILSRGEADVVLGAMPSDASGVMSRALGSIHFGVLARKGHPALGRTKKLRAEAFAAYPHVMVRTGTSTPSVMGSSIARAGLSRRVGVVVPSFLTAPFVVAQTDCFFSAPRELIEPVARTLGLVVLDPPIATPALPVAVLWHARVDGDPAHQWFRAQLVASLAGMFKRSR